VPEKRRQRGPLGEFELIREVDDLRRALSDTQMKLARAKAKTDDLVDAALEGARDAMLALGPVAPVPAPKLRPGKGKPEVALWHSTDWQGGKLSTSYNSAVMRERLMRFCDKAERLTNIHRAGCPVDEAVLLLGGDLIEGLLIFPGQAFEVDSTIFTQWVHAARLVVDIVRRALAIYKRVRVVAEWGNHGRVGESRSNVPRSDNYDRMAYFHAREMLAGEKRLTWQDSDEDVQNVEIGNYRAILFHGDEVGRHGKASPTTIVKHVAFWKSGSHGWPFQDAYFGHLHNHQEWALPDGTGAVFMTGAPESDNRYAYTTLASRAMPTQRLHFIDPEEGFVTAQYKVRLTAPKPG
jgi:hypothetical protein